jgi:hypothetical protein
MNQKASAKFAGAFHLLHVTSKDLIGIVTQSGFGAPMEIRTPV